MSLVYITYHDENIFDVDKQDLQAHHSALKYISKHRKMVKKEKAAKHIIDLGDNRKLLTSSVKNYHQTMGYAETPLRAPCNFMRKNQGVKWSRLNEHRCPPKRFIPPVPRLQNAKVAHDEKSKDEPEKEKKAESTSCPQAQTKSFKHRANFVALNIDKIKNSKSKRPPPRYVDTPTGDRHNLLNAGLIPQYTCSKNFGKVPCYIHARKKMLEKYNAQCADAKILAKDACLRGMTDVPGLKKLGSDERQDILAGLKRNFGDIFKSYQGLSLYTDTIAKKLRKGKYERELRQLEQDIFLMESNPEIYISEY
uniref:Enkurin domain-containing protein n=1 Tax=Glossina morsitans morsitans TaxID=37546 RepID=A0A1B0G8G1_GLOMM